MKKVYSIQYLTILVLFSLMSIISAQDFSASITATGGNSNTTLVFGFSPSATDGYDPGIDVYAPPAPPGGFDVALRWPSGSNERYYVQILEGDGNLSEHVFDIQLQFPGDSVITISWDHSFLSNLGDFTLVDGPTNGMIYNVDMTTQNSLQVDNTLVTILLLKVTPADVYGPTADFTADITEGVAPLTVNFSDGSTPGSVSIVEWSWDFGDDSTSTDQNPTHTYASAGFYTVSLSVTDEYGLSDTFIQIDYIHIIDDVSLTLTPLNPPIEIPAGGGTFDYNVLIVNNTDIPQTFYAVLFADMPNGNQYGPISPTPYLVQLPAGASVDVDLTQNVPGNAPAGMYTYYCLVGAGYNSIIDSSGFTFTKLGTVQAGGIVEWIRYYRDVGVEMRENDMWTVDGIYREDGTLIYGSMGSLDEISLPESFTLYQNYPNPFNPVTTIRYDLPEQSHVTIVIYDIMGRQVKELVNAAVVSGYYKVVWDGMDSFGKPVAAGMYLCQIMAYQFYNELSEKADDHSSDTKYIFTETKKVMLIK